MGVLSLWSIAYILIGFDVIFCSLSFSPNILIVFISFCFGCHFFRFDYKNLEIYDGFWSVFFFMNKILKTKSKIVLTRGKSKRQNHFDFFLFFFFFNFIFKVLVFFYLRQIEFLHFNDTGKAFILLYIRCLYLEKGNIMGFYSVFWFH